MGGTVNKSKDLCSVLNSFQLVNRHTLFPFACLTFVYRKIVKFL